MELRPFDSRLAFVALLVLVGAGRLIELRLSRRHQRALAAQGFTREREPGFPIMVALHTAILIGAALEVTLARRPFIVAVAVPALALFMLANALRWWVIRTMAAHWNVQVVNALALGVVTTGPFRWIRHPNYVAVFVELLALPLIHCAYVTAIVGGAAHALVLARRIAFEERVLLANPTYRRAMAGKPRFIPARVAWPRVDDSGT